MSFLSAFNTLRLLPPMPLVLMEYLHRTITLHHTKVMVSCYRCNDTKPPTSFRWFLRNNSSNASQQQRNLQHPASIHSSHEWSVSIVRYHKSVQLKPSRKVCAPQRCGMPYALALWLFLAHFLYSRTNVRSWTLGNIMRNHHISSVSLVTAKLMFKESAATEKTTNLKMGEQKKLFLHPQTQKFADGGRNGS